MIRSVAPDGRPDLGGVFRPIDRPRVLDRLANAGQYRIATIIAPAGFGKSVAVRQYLETVRSSVVYDVPSDATTLLPFVRAFADALEAVVPAMRRSLATALDGSRSSATPTRDLAAWAATHLRTLDTLIVIDDLHVGEGDPEISRFITAVVERTKDGPRWLFSSRSPLQLPVASWLAYGESDLVVDAVDLRFNAEEAKQSARAAHVAVRAEELDAILELVDGWPAALTFALRSSTRASDLRAVSDGTREMVYRYLAEQVWHAMPDRARSFLRTVAFLPRVEMRLAVAAGFDDAASIIEMLRERVAFVSIQESGVYKLHDLFRDFVEREVQLEGSDALREARVAAARVLETVGMHGAALERYVAAGALDDVERVMDAVNFALLETGHYDIVESALRIVPPSRAQKRPGILALRAAIEDSYGRTDQAERWYRTILDQPIENVSFHVSVAWRYALMRFMQNRHDAIPMLEELRQRTDLSESDRAQVVGTLAMTLAHAGRTAEARASLEEAFVLAEFADDEVRARTYGRAATVAFYASDGEAVERYTREATRLASECAAFGLAARLFSALLAHNAREGKVPVAAWYAAQVIANAEKAGDPQMRALGLRALLDFEAERGNFDRAEEIDRELAQSSYRGTAALIGVLTGRTLIAAREGRFAEAQAMLASVPAVDLRPSNNRQRLGLLAVVACAAGDRRGASQALTEYAPPPDGTDVDRDDGFGQRYAVLANILLGRNAFAQKLLRSAVHVGTHLEVFAALDAALTALLNRLPEAFDDALRRIRLAGSVGVAHLVDAVARPLLAELRAPVSPLTAVELQVLRAMTLGLTNQAIADEQHRTINTVRTHVSAILRKLGCESRGEAVATARRRGLI